MKQIELARMRSPRNDFSLSASSFTFFTFFEVVVDFVLLKVGAGFEFGRLGLPMRLLLSTTDATHGVPRGTNLDHSLVPDTSLSAQ